MKVLIVDDLVFMRTAIRDILEKNGYTVVGEASNGREGVKLYLEKRPDAVLLDITMPVMDGIQALRHIRHRDPKAKVIMCSAMGQQEYIIKAIQLGAKDFIIKPFVPERITGSLKKVLGK